MNDALRGLIMSAVTSVVDFLVLITLLNWSAVQVAGADLAIGNLVLLAAYLWKGRSSVPITPVVPPVQS